MEPPNLRLWQAKLAAWLHDPPEKALVLARTVEGHEGGTAARLYEFCFGGEIGKELRRLAALADHWAAASDRPQWPLPKEGKTGDQQLLFWSRKGAELVHPLGGDHYQPGDLYVTVSGRIVKAAADKIQGLLAEATGDVEFTAAATASSGTIRELINGDAMLAPAGIPDDLGKEESRTLEAIRRAVLALWRLGPVSDPEGLGLGEVWRLLPADSRVPDHSIWEHNALASAFAGALAADDQENPALLLVSLGPVQGFIEQARSTSDLWAGSHLLSCLAWQAMKPVAEKYGPDAIVFPSLWGVPLVDVWLEEQGLKLPDDSNDRRCPQWKRTPTDANPLFSPCLPNRFVAVVPAGAAADLARDITRAVRCWMLEQTEESAAELCQLAGVEPTDDMRGQLERQLAGFPEVYWAAVPFRPLIEGVARRSAEAKRQGGDDQGEGQKGERVAWDTGTLDVAALRQALERFLGSQEPGFLGTEFWKTLTELPTGARQAGPEAGALFLRYEPNPGTLYPALLQLAERAQAASKATREFAQTREEGYRCSLCGEREWLRGPGDDQPPASEAGKSRPRRRFELPRGQRENTLWQILSEKHPAIAKSGEHLCALCATKRLWPRRFATMAAAWAQFPKEKVPRFVVSTHAMALAPDLAQLPLARQPSEPEESFRQRQKALDRLRELARKHGDPWSVLPKKLADALESKAEEARKLARAVPELFDRAREADSGGGESASGEPAAISRDTLERLFQQAFSHRPETYYGLILMDGDEAGKWLSGDPELMLRLEDLWHSELTLWLQRQAGRDGPVARLLACPRPASPGYHAALSGAMSAFAQEVARWVVEDLFLGRLIYSGGDDALAMVAVDDLLPCMFALRCAFSGIVPSGERDSVFELYRQLGTRLGDIDRGHVRVRGRLLRAMGGRMTASMGAVVAHHEAPLQAVLRRLRKAEKDAKDNGRNSFSIALVKRGGGETTYTASWGFGGAQRNGLAPDAHRDVPYIPDQWADVLTKGLVTPMGVLVRLRDTLDLPFVSRRAVYHALEWLSGLPAHPGCQQAPMEEEAYTTMLTDTLAWQLREQGLKAKNFEKGCSDAARDDGDPAVSLAEAIVAVALRQCRPWGRRTMWRSVPEHLAQMLTVAEFLAREGRAPQRTAPEAGQKGGEA